MRFYQEYGGFIWEFNSLGEYLKAVLARIIGRLLGLAILIGGCLLLYYIYK